MRMAAFARASNCSRPDGMRMNKWLRRTVGTVGIAGGIWLLGSGTAHADASTPANDPQRLTGLLDSLFTPAGGPSNLGLTMVDPGHLAPQAGRTVRELTSQVPHGVPALLHALPITEVVPVHGLGAVTAPQESGIAGLPFIGDDLPLAGSLPLADALPAGLVPDQAGLPGLDSLPDVGSLPALGAP